ncbi:hypothetical protein ENH_00045420, partial [Eimeria necatrix]
MLKELVAAGLALNDSIRDDGQASSQLLLLLVRREQPVRESKRAGTRECLLE